MPRRSDEIVAYVGIIGLGRIPVTRRDRRRERITGVVPGLHQLIAWLDCSVPLTRNRLAGWLGPVPRYMREMQRTRRA